MSKFKRFLKHGFKGASVRGLYWLAHPDERAELLLRMASFADGLGEHGASARLQKAAARWIKLKRIKIS